MSDKPIDGERQEPVSMDTFAEMLHTAIAADIEREFGAVAEIPPEIPPPITIVQTGADGVPTAQNGEGMSIAPVTEHAGRSLIQDMIRLRPPTQGLWRDRLLERLHEQTPEMARLVGVDYANQEMRLLGRELRVHNWDAARDIVELAHFDGSIQRMSFAEALDGPLPLIPHEREALIAARDTVARMRAANNAPPVTGAAHSYNEETNHVRFLQLDGTYRDVPLEVALAQPTLSAHDRAVLLGARDRYLRMVNRRATGERGNVLDRDRIYEDANEVLGGHRPRISSIDFVDSATAPTAPRKEWRAVFKKATRKEAEVMPDIKLNAESIPDLIQKLANLKGSTHPKLGLYIGAWLENNITGRYPAGFTDRWQFEREVARTPRTNTSQELAEDTTGNPVCCEQTMMTISVQGFYQCHKCHSIYSFCSACDGIQEFCPTVVANDPEAPIGEFGMCCVKCNHILAMGAPNRKPEKKKAAPRKKVAK